MNVQDVRTWFGYNRWANERLLAAAADLSVDELDRDLGGSFGSIRATLRHILWGERGWFRYWRERSFGPALAPADYPDLSSLAASWRELEEQKNVFASDLTEESLFAPLPVDDDAYVLSELIQHALNHSTHHRGQITHMLRELGRTPPGTGFRQFLAATRTARGPS